MSALPAMPAAIMPPRQAACTVLMVRPASFSANAQTLASNAFQQPVNETADQILLAARREFERAVEQLRRHGVSVVVLEEQVAAGTPDALFPNNWFSTHADGHVVLYPMAVPNRRGERRPGSLATLAARYGWQIRRTTDLSVLEASEAYVEGTGSLVLDRVHAIAYAARSARTSEAGVAAACRALGFEPQLFQAEDASGRAIYHTNVLMSVGPRIAVVGDSLLPQADERHRLATTLERTGHEWLPLSAAQVGEFAGNVLFLESARGEPLLAVSQRGWRSLNRVQRTRLEAHALPVICDVPLIERCGGGGIRCMLAEIFLPGAERTANGSNPADGVSAP